MASLLKRSLFFLFAVMLLRAAPALSVPLNPGNDPGTARYGSADNAPEQDATNPSDGQLSPFRRIGGGSDGSVAEARIVDSEELAYGPYPDRAELAASNADNGRSGRPAVSGGGIARSGKTPGWIKPVAIVGAGSSLYALFSHKNHGSSNASANGLSSQGGLGGSVGNGGGGGTGGSTPGSINDETPGDNPPVTTPEPGTMLLMGLGLAGYLGRRKMVKK